VLIREQRAAHIEGFTAWQDEVNTDAMQAQAVCLGVFAPPPIDPGVSVIGISDAWVVQIAHMTADLVIASGDGTYPKQRATGFMAASQQFYVAGRGLEDAIVVFHGVVDEHWFVMLEPPPDKDHVGFDSALGGERGV
jgi:hypothetical protein